MPRLTVGVRGDAWLPVQRQHVLLPRLQPVRCPAEPRGPSRVGAGLLPSGAESWAGAGSMGKPRSSRSSADTGQEEAGTSQESLDRLSKDWSGETWTHSRLCRGQSMPLCHRGTGHSPSPHQASRVSVPLTSPIRPPHPPLTGR